jgi:hypothetical protein
LLLQAARAALIEKGLAVLEIVVVGHQMAGDLSLIDRSAVRQRSSGPSHSLAGFLKAGWFPLVINRDQFDEYMEAIERADAGDLAGLAGLFWRIQKKELIRTLSASEDALRQTAPISQVIA